MILFSSILTGCSTTKSLSEGEVLYRGERIGFNKYPDTASWKVEISSEKFANVYWALWDSPNGALFGMPVTIFYPARLFIYNDFYNEKTKGFNYWVRENFGEPPKTISFINPEIKLQKGVSIFEEYGHFGTTGHFKLNYNKRRNKAYIRYYFDIKKGYRYRNVTFGGLPQYPHLDTKVIDFGKTSVLTPDTEFNLYKIRTEKSNLVALLQDSGYYFLMDKNIIISADTTIGAKRLDLRMGVEKNLPKAYYQQQYLNSIHLAIDSIPQDIKIREFYTWEYGKIKSKVLDSLIDIKSNSRYSLSDTKRTNFLLSELGVFSSPRIEYSINPNDSTLLDPTITLNSLDATNIGFNIRGNYKNTGYIGPSIGFTFRQLNLFHGAENLAVNGDIYYDFPIGVYKSRVSDSYGFSLRSTLIKPLLASPFKFITHKYSLPKQFYKFSIEWNVRKNYFNLTTINASYGWTWKQNSNVTHTFGVIDITLSTINEPTKKFNDLVDANPILKATLVNQFLFGPYYEFNIKNKASTFKRWSYNYTGRIDFSGNALNLISTVFTNQPTGEQRFLGLKYAQYTRISSQIVTNYHISKTHQLVFRNVTGIGLAYGNSAEMPFIKQYFIGGTNSLRPFSARVVGPGRYFQTDPAEVNQLGDLKIEFNVEFRMPLVWKLNLAIFSDMGNIWLLRPDPARPGGEIRWNKIAQDSYLTTGMGVRLDMGYLVLRADLGMVVYSPVFNQGKRWVWEADKIQWAPIIGIGYPF